MDKEFQSCEQQQTWTLVRRADLPRGANVIPPKWVYKVKNDETGEVTEYKARLTPKGFRQRHGVDYFEVFAHTGKYKTMRVGLSLTASQDLEMEHLDVPSAFLNAELEEDVYMELPPGYEREGYVCQLNKALYGLKQGPRNWYLLFSGFLVKELGFEQCVSDPCLLWKRSRGGRLILLFLFVDDIQASFDHADAAEWNEAKVKLVERFRIKDLGPSRFMLGMRVTRDRKTRTIQLDQELYVSKALEKYGLTQCRTASTPEAVGSGREQDDSDGAGKPADRQRFMEIVGTLLYAAISTRPDIAHAVGQLTQHMQAPLRRHAVAAERVLRYLAGTKTLGLTFGRSSSDNNRSDTALRVSGFSDADWANDKADRKSISGWVVMMNGDPISWSSKKQRVVSLSTCESELYAQASAAQELLYQRGLLQELGLTVATPSTLHGDNQSGIAVATHGVKSERTKHVDIKYHFLTDSIASGALKLQWIPTTEQQADIFTKALAAPLFERFRELLMPQ
jgi:hypothetical protein